MVKTHIHKNASMLIIFQSAFEAITAIAVKWLNN